MARILAGLAMAGAFLWLCRDASIRMPEARPDIRRCLDEPSRWAGREVWIRPAAVEAHVAEGWIVRPHDRPILVRSPERPPAGRYVRVRGVFRADGSVEATKVAEEPAYPLKRVAIYLVSIPVLLGLAWTLVRRFAWRRGALRLRGTS